MLHTCSYLYCSLRGRRPKGRERGKNDCMKCMRVEDACKDSIVFFISPLIKYAKPTQLWNVLLSKLSNQNHAAYLTAKSVGAKELSFLVFIFCARK